MELDPSLSAARRRAFGVSPRHVCQDALCIFLHAVEDGQAPAGSVLIVVGSLHLHRTVAGAACPDRERRHHSRRRPRVQPRVSQSAVDGSGLQPAGDDPGARGIGYEEQTGEGGDPPSAPRIDRRHVARSYPRREKSAVGAGI